MVMYVDRPQAAGWLTAGQKASCAAARGKRSHRSAEKLTTIEWRHLITSP